MEPHLPFIVFHDFPHVSFRFALLLAASVETVKKEFSVCSWDQKRAGLMSEPQRQHAFICHTIMVQRILDIP